MFPTLKAKFFFLVTIIMVTTAAGIAYFTYKEVGDAMITAERASAENILRLVELNIQGGYNRLLSEKIDLMASSTQELKESATLIASVFDTNNQLAADGIVSTKEAQRRSLYWLKAAHSHRRTFFVFDGSGLVKGASEAAVDGRSVGEMRDIKGRRIHDVIGDAKLESDGDYTVFFWDDPGSHIERKKLGYFFPYPRWNWTVCSMLDFVDIEAEAQKKKDSIIKALASVFENIQVAKSGYAFLFSGSGDILIPPKGFPPLDYKTLINHRTGRRLLTDLKTTAQHKPASIQFSITLPNGRRPTEATVRHLKAFDWYLVIAVPVQELHAPGNVLITRHSGVILAIFLISLVAAYVFVSRISRPLKRLTAYVREIPLQDFTDASAGAMAPQDLPIDSNDEVGHLTETFMIMKAELRKNIQNAMESQTKYRETLESIDEGFFETDLNGRLTFFNRCICELLGYDRDAIMGTHCRRYTSQNTFQRVRRVFGKVHDTGVPMVIPNCEIIRKDGGKKNLELTIYPAKDQIGQWVGFRGIARDISERLKAEAERKRLEAQLLRSQKMEALGTLAGGIAHDFNNILTAVIGYSELVVHAHPAGTRSRKNLEEVLKASFRAKDLVNQILTFSHQTDKELKPVNIDPIVTETLTFLKATIPPTIEIKKSMSAASDIVFSDPTQIHQVIMNLCTNAAQAMWDKGGILDITLSEVEIDSAIRHECPGLPFGCYLKIRVKDSGHGMNQDVQERIFDPYFTTKEKGKGTGLGLSVTLGIVKSHGGTITVSSEQKKGTAFDVFLPLAGETIPVDHTPPNPLPAGIERILFVDDERPILDMAEQMLEGLGYTVEAQQHTAHALDQFKRAPHRYDVVITDQVMPEMTGLELAAELKAIRSDIPVILCSGNVDPSLHHELSNGVVRKFLPKPLAMEDLAHTIRAVLTSSS